MVSAIPFRPSLMAIACAMALSVRAELPRDPTVVAGQVAIEQQGALVRQFSDKAIIDWRQFNIGADQLMRFLQPGSRSIILNRVTGNDPSSILGQLQANGRVFLVNPNGVYFGANARVDVGALLATSYAIRNEDFLAGRYRFLAAGQAGQVRNDGRLRAADGGFVALAGSRVANHGLVEARLGSVLLASGQALELDLAGDGLIGYVLDPAVAGSLVGVDNAGSILADGGRVVLAASAARAVAGSAVNHSGLIRAAGVAERNGVIELLAQDGEVNVSGAVHADSAQGSGGRVALYGRQVGVAGSAALSADGRDGGGTLLIGGDWQGSGPVTAQHTTVAAGARFSADALERGQGGKVVVWADGRTEFAGSISARGGRRAGDGGQVEVSGKHALRYDGKVDTRADAGLTGQLLIDPATLTVVDAATAGTDEITRASLEAIVATSNVSLVADGLITINNMAGNLINLKQTGGNSVTMQSTASGGIKFLDVNDEIRTAGGSITLQALGSGSLQLGKLTSNGGAINLKSAANALLGNDVRATGGSITLDMGNGVAQSTAKGLYTTNGLLLKGSGYFKLLSYNDNGNFYQSFNQIGNLAASLSGGSVQFSHNGAFTVGSVAGVNGIQTSGASVQIYNNNGLTLSQDFNVGGGSIFMLAGSNGVNQTGGSVIADGLILSGAGTFTLNQANNDLNVLTASVTGAVTFRDKDNLAVGNVWGWSKGISTGGNNLTLTTGAPIATPDYNKTQGDAANPASLKIDENINVGSGLVRLNLDAGGVLQRNEANVSDGSITAGSLLVSDGSSTSKVNQVSLSNGYNAINTLAARLNGSFFYTGAGNNQTTVTIGSVGGVSGIRTTSNTIIAAATTNPDKPATYNPNDVALSIGGNLNIDSAIEALRESGGTRYTGSVTVGIGGDYTARTAGGIVIKANSLGVLGEVGQGTFNIKSFVETLVAGGGKNTVIDNSSYTGLLAAAAIGAVSDAIDVDVPAAPGSSGSSSAGSGSPPIGSGGSAGGGTTQTLSVTEINKPVGNFYLTTGDDLRIVKLNSQGDNLFLRANNVDVVLDAATKDGARIILQPYGLNRSVKIQKDDPASPFNVNPAISDPDLRYVSGYTTDTTYSWETLLKFSNLTSTFYIGSLPYVITDATAVAVGGTHFTGNIRIGQNGAADLSYRSLSAQTDGDITTDAVGPLYNLRLLGRNLLVNGFSTFGDKIHFISDSLAMNGADSQYISADNVKVTLRNLGDQTIWVGPRPGNAAFGNETEYTEAVLRKFNDKATLIISGTDDMPFGSSPTRYSQVYTDIHVANSGSFGLGNRKLVLDTPNSITVHNTPPSLPARARPARPAAYGRAAITASAIAAKPIRR
ncbi:filamentous hemagglutinin N-terminal domain-containing protein [Chitinimonas arctica]|uniref:Filamentous hemagglutinin N-terminal domain-containing protein n=1 Tax=Chitinimonas arctica TaxID=2594795 RepID=A0A516SA05_9NEIS|nr:filamentous hemagglutinin N-terminal domain-containing protein [Chitinimonas arctica]QDQ24985.1 filamentous hemagglutinin N-terminal domain-containing protein [Chitinimonas arctica]